VYLWTPLGIDKSATTRDADFRGPAAGATPISFSEVTIDLHFTELYSVYAGFADSMNDGWFLEDGVGCGVFGPMGFFDRFKVAFDLRNKVFEIET
jgi:hypothetical protein